MDFLEFKLWKAGVLLVVICVVSFWRGYTGQDDDDQ